MKLFARCAPFELALLSSYNHTVCSSHVCSWCIYTSNDGIPPAMIMLKMVFLCFITGLYSAAPRLTYESFWKSALDSVIAAAVCFYFTLLAIGAGA